MSVTNAFFGDFSKKMNACHECCKVQIFGDVGELKMKASTLRMHAKSGG